MQSLKLQQSYEENALVVIENVLTLMDIPVSKKSLEQVQYLPDFPSLSTLGVALREFGIETFATRLNLEQLLEMDYPLVVHLNKNEGSFALATEMRDGKITWHDPDSGWTTDSPDNFALRWTGITMLLEKTSHAADPDFAVNTKHDALNRWRKVAIAGLTGLLIFTILFLSSGITELFVKILSITGIVVSALLVATELGSEITRSFCQAGKKTDCNSVLKSPASIVFGWIKMTDIGMVWFSGMLISSIVGNVSGHVNEIMAGLLILNAAALMYVPFSIYYQGLKVKRWCTLCLIVQAILVINFCLLYAYSTSLNAVFTDSVAMYSLALSFITPLLFWMWIRPMIAATQQLPFRQQELYKLKHDPELFNQLLRNKRTVETFPLPVEFQIGQEQAPLQLTVVTNPFCEPCKKAHRLLTPLVQQMDDQLAITFRFLIDFKNVNDPGRIFAIHFLSLPGETQAAAYHDWIRLNDYKAWSALYPATISSDAEATLREHALWCDWAQVTKTPTFFLNMHETPAPFGIEELRFHIRHFKPEEVTQNV